MCTKIGIGTLLVTGLMDHNVDPSSTFQVADRLIKANKTFDLLVVPSLAIGDPGNTKADAARHPPPSS